MPESDAPFPEVLTRDQLRFEIKFGLQQVGKCVIRDWASSNREKAEQARGAVIDSVLVRFDKLQVRAPAPAEPIFRDKVKSS
ncbi:hypothetical protein HNO88_002933 [Novosphingobium chloroacetimidivorans]|uniref:Uncharacterized protein n=1 Tax=Novosphingobium chloroacetimidivorans TaxID=1428314 RepID=A0A7W7KB70_9SPHN|nr:hypothetical protein [Novosphingobium chloroacetimidivorans]MBB4859604.1 hypothetical protein [Novosphingobium chloroacetimidivorans]